MLWGDGQVAIVIRGNADESIGWDWDTLNSASDASRHASKE